MNHQRKSFAFACSFAVLALLSVYLLATTHYFSLSDLSAVDFGLFGAELKAEFSTYSTLEANCDEAHLLADYCDSLPHMKAAGAVLATCLLLDCCLLSAYVGVFARRRYGRHAERRWFLRTELIIRWLVFLHPFLVLGGFVTWVLICDFEALQWKVTMERGALLSICDAFASLFLAALYIQFLLRPDSSHQRVNRSVSEFNLKEDSLECSRIENRT